MVSLQSFSDSDVGRARKRVGRKKEKIVTSRTFYIREENGTFPSRWRGKGENEIRNDAGFNIHIRY